MKLILALLASLLLFPPSIDAQQLIDLRDPNSPFANTYNIQPASYIRTSILALLGLSGVAAFLFLLIGGFQWITAGSDKDAVEKARRKISYALIGLAIVFSSYAILYIIRTLFNVNLIEYTITPL